MFCVQETVAAGGGMVFSNKYGGSRQKDSVASDLKSERAMRTTQAISVSSGQFCPRDSLPLARQLLSRGCG